MSPELRIPASELRLRVRQRLDDGRLLVTTPASVIAGYGRGKGADVCRVCDEEITESQVLYDFRYPHSTTQLTLHLICYTTWQQECAQRVAAESRKLPGDTVQPDPDEQPSMTTTPRTERRNCSLSCGDNLEVVRHCRCGFTGRRQSTPLSIIDKRLKDYRVFCHGERPKTMLPQSREHYTRIMIEVTDDDPEPRPDRFSKPGFYQVVGLRQRDASLLFEPM
jgi:hypothetical protein